VGHLVSTRPYDANRAFVSINNTRIESEISAAAWRQTRSFYEDGYWEVDHDFIPASMSKGYRWNAEWRSKSCSFHIIHCPRFKRHLDAVHAKHRNRHYGPIEWQQEMDMRHLGLPDNFDSLSFATALPDKPGVKDVNHRISVFVSCSFSIIDGHIGVVTRDDFGRRSHCLVTRTPRELRPHLTLCGAPTVEIDLGNSQPYFSAAIFRDIPGLARSVSNGSFYAHINQFLPLPYDLTDPDSKDRLKRHCLMMMFAGPKNGCEWFKEPDSPVWNVRRAADLAFPGFTNAIDSYRKCHGDNALVRKLQLMESGVFIDSALAHIQTLGIRAIPIHDALLCRQRDAPQVRQILAGELQRATGIPPNLRTSGLEWKN